jgi:uncharacterized membrane protein
MWVDVRLRMLIKSSASRRDALFVILVMALSCALFFVPSGFKSAVPAARSERVPAKVLKVDNSMVKQIGPIKEGEQQLDLRVLRGKHKGQNFSSSNILIGKMELDKYFAPGDTAYVVLDLRQDGSVAYANVIDHYRTDKTIILIALFFVCLVVVAGWVGLKAIASFVFTGAILLKFLLPSALWGWDPIWTTLAVVALLCAVIIFLVGGFTRKGVTAFVGSVGGIVVTSILAVIFTESFHIHGAVRPFTETLLYSGFPSLNLSRLFIAGIFLASSGAVMDLSMDISAAMTEIAEKNPGLSRLELVRSGFTVSRHVTGTMTTTLLLAYSGGYTAMLMTFIAQGVPFENVINMVYVSSELIHTLVGSFGLILVGPLTAVAGGFFLRGEGQSRF